MNAPGANLPSGWLVAVFCWFILRVLRRLDDIEKQQKETVEYLESVEKRLRLKEPV